MLKRLCFPAIAIFWIVMNVLLWRSEFSGGRDLASAVPVENVVRRILTAPDDSALEVSHHGKKIGYCRWRVNVGSDHTVEAAADDDPEMEARITQLSEYRIDLEGNVVLEEIGGRLRLDVHGIFGTNLVWKKFSARATHRPVIWEVEADASAERVELRVDDGESKQARQFQFADLSQPDKLLRSFGAPLPPGLLAQLGLPGLNTPSGTMNLALGLRWEARQDWLKIGHTRLRVYRLEARWFDRYRATIIVSRVGEILRVELPDGWILMNDALAGI